MRRLLIALLITLLIAGAMPSASAQEGDMAYFESFDGLQRIIGRAWMAPITYSSASSSQTVEINDQGTPIVVSETFSTPAATPEPRSGIGMLAVFVYLFDSDENAASGFDRVDDELQETVRRDPRAPFTDDLPLDDVGDQAVGYMGDHNQGDITFTYTNATVQDGPFVYSVTGMFAGVDSAELTREYAEALVRQPMNRMAEQYDPAGGSRGGLWSKLDGVQPDMPPGSTVTDLIVYPMPDATPGAFPEAPRLDLDSPDSIEGLATLNQVTYTLAGDATPAPDVAGVFRIDTWILTFDSTEEANASTVALGNTLIEPFIIVGGGAGAEASTSGESSSSTAWYEGYIDDRSLPPGKGIVSVLHYKESVYAVVVYAIDEDPQPIADKIMRSMTEDSTIPPDERFPERGDPVLHGLVPTSRPEPMATPAG